MEHLVISEYKLGIIAGGQLGKMLVLAASNWNIQTYIMDKDEDCPAASCSWGFWKGDPLSYNDLLNFGRKVDMVLLEIENANIEALRQLKLEGKRVYPDPDILEIIQDKGKQKEYYRNNGIPTAGFTLFTDTDQLLSALYEESIKYPFVQKLRRGGYDGRGVAVINSPDDLPRLLQGASLVEEKIQVAKEVSIIVARNNRGEVRCFPLAEMIFNEEANLVEYLFCPSDLPSDIQQKAETIATALISSLKLCGLLAVEMFVDAQGAILVNESAPRPHNSGHHTIESIVTSQYEQTLRAIFNFPLGSTRLKSPSVMINLLGEPGYFGKVHYEGLTDSLGIEGVKIHLYGKKETHPFRKMGHVTVLAPTIQEAKVRAEKVRTLLKVKA